MSSPLARGATILFISAMPSDEVQIDSSGEFRAIDDAVRGHFKLIAKLAARPQDLVFALAEHKPQVLHFSGHGTGKGGLAFENDQRTMVLLERKALERVFAAKELVAPLQLIVLNACWSEEQARDIAKEGPDIIGMKIDVLDEVAKAFANGFYRTLVSGMSVEGAHAAAIAATEAQGLPEADSPVLWKGKGAPRPPVTHSDQIDRRALRTKLEELFPGDELQDMIFYNFPVFARNFAGLQIARSVLLRQFLQWVLEVPSRMTLLEKSLSEKELNKET